MHKYEQQTIKVKYKSKEKDMQPQDNTAMCYRKGNRLPCYLLLHEMNVEFFAQLLFVKILRPPQFLIFLNDSLLEKLDGEKC